MGRRSGWPRGRRSAMERDCVCAFWVERWALRARSDPGSVDMSRASPGAMEVILCCV